MKIIETIIYECEHCKRYYKSKYFAELHEPKCKKNPDNFQRCMNCFHIEKKETKVYYNASGLGEGLGVYYLTRNKMMELMYCNKKEHYIYPYWINNPILQEDIEGEIANEPMPKECDVFNLIGIKCHV